MGAPSAFRQRDVTRAIKAARAAGMSPHVWIDRAGVLHIEQSTGLTAPAAEPLPSNDPNPWDALLGNDQA